MGEVCIQSKLQFIELSSRFPCCGWTSVSFVCAGFELQAFLTISPKYIQTISQSLNLIDFFIDCQRGKYNLSNSDML